MNIPLISIVIPVFNGEKYLDCTVKSILEQTFFRFEVLLVDDCSTDSSSAIIEKYKESDPRVVALKTKVNLGMVPRVLAFALPFVRGDYFLYASQDDLFSTDWLENMYERAIGTGADAVIPDMKFFHEDASIKDREWIGLNGNRNAILSNRNAVSLSLDWVIHGFVLWKIDIIRGVGFFDFGMYADDYSVKNFFFKSNKIVFSTGVFYYRQDNPSAITKKVSYKRFDQPFNYFKIYQFLTREGFAEEVCERELEKAVIDFIGYSVELISLKKTESAHFIAEAETRVDQCFNALSDKSILGRIKKFGGFKGRLRYFALKGGRTFFGMWCRAFYVFKTLKKSINIIKSLGFGNAAYQK